MSFFYNSTHGGQRELPSEEVRRIREHLESRGFSSQYWNKGMLQDALLEYRRESGEQLMINQLAPIFTYVAQYGLWPQEGTAQETTEAATEMQPTGMAGRPRALNPLVAPFQETTEAAP